MNYIESSQTDGTVVNLYYEDWGYGAPVIFIHGWPLSHEMWEYQLTELPKHGLRCIAYDRRGFGKSDKPWNGYDYDTLADDLKAVIDQLNLQNVTLVGFSMGGGEVVRYFSRHGGARVSKVVLVSSVAPYVLKTDDNPDGVPVEMVNEIIEGLKKDRPAFLSSFGKYFYGVNLISHPVSQDILDWSLMLALHGSPKATIDCVHSFCETDFRKEMGSINVPALVIHGDKDQTVPIKPTGEKAAEMIANAQYLVYESAPHGLFYTEKDKLNQDLLNFIRVPHIETMVM
jgi:pimeloyl-ACP methyl ester carboxylesterase